MFDNYLFIFFANFLKFFYNHITALLLENWCPKSVCQIPLIYPKNYDLSGQTWQRKTCGQTYLWFRKLFWFQDESVANMPGCCIRVEKLYLHFSPVVQDVKTSIQELLALKPILNRYLILGTNNKTAGILFTCRKKRKGNINLQL